MKKVLGFALAASFLVSVTASTVFASDGASLYKARNCVGCHQANGKGGGPFPKLAGKDKAFLVEQFTAIQDGTRKTGMAGTMRVNPGVKKTTAEEIGAIATYLSAL